MTNGDRQNDSALPSVSARAVTRRRTILQGAVGALASVSLAPFGRTVFAADPLAVTPVTDEIALLTGAGGNVLAHATSDGQVLIDSGAAEFTAALLAKLKELPGGGRVRTLFNTHWHSDQIGANAALGRAGAKIVAHEKTRLHLATDYYLPAEDRYQKAVPTEAQPTEAFYTTGEMTAGNERLEYGYLLEAHTDGDIYVFFRDANVLAVGDAVSPLRDPVLDWFGGGWLGGRIDSLAMILELANAQTRIVPSYGPVVKRAEVQAEHDIMLKLFERMVDLIRKGDSAEDILAAGVMDDLGRTFDAPLKFLQDAYKGCWAHHNTLSPDVV